MKRHRKRKPAADTRVLTSLLGSASRVVGLALDGERGKLKAEEDFSTLFPILRTLGKEDIRLHSQVPSGHDFWGNYSTYYTGRGKIKH